MASIVQMPKQGNTVVECLLVEWKVSEGDQVKEGDALCVIETDKASFEVPAAVSGTVLRLLVKAGDLAPVLSGIAVLGEPGENADAAAPAPAVPPASTPSAPAAPVPPAGAPAAPPPAVSGPAGAPVSPRGRKLAEKLGANPAGLAGSGPGGRITARDIQAALDAGRLAKASPLAKEILSAAGQTAPARGSGPGGLVLARDLTAPTAAPAGAPAEDAEAIPFQGIRKIIGDRMRQSLERHAQLTMSASADASGLRALRRLFKEKAGSDGLPDITMNDLVCWAAARVLTAFPEVNAVFERERGAIIRHRRVHLALAVDTPRGLMVPVIADAQRLSLAEFAVLTARRAADCRQGSINPDLLSGGTFTVSNLGSLGVESFTPIVNSPQVAILGVCAIRETPVPAAGGFVFQPRLGLSLTIDHQAVDGAPAARFLQALVKEIENLQGGLAWRGALERPGEA